MASHSTYLEQLATVPLFSTFSRRELTKVARAADEVKVSAGRAVVVEGKVGRECFIILSGDAIVSRDGTTIANFGPGDHFGELALLDGGPRTATVDGQDRPRACWCSASASSCRCSRRSRA